MSDDRQRDIAYQHRASRGIDLLPGVGVCVTSINDNILRCEVFREDTDVELILFFYYIFMAESKKISNKAHGLGVASIISLIIWVIIMLSSLTSDYVTHQTAAVLYALFFLILAILFQLMKFWIKD